MQKAVTDISIEKLEALCLSALIKADIRKKDAGYAADHFLENELSGKASHGIIRVVEAAKAARKLGAAQRDPEIIHDKGNIAVLEAKNHIGAAAGRYALDMTLERAPAHGLTFIGVRDYIASTGSMAYYLRRLAEAGLIAFMGCNSVAQVAAPGGCERVIGTNPVGLAVPGQSGAALIGDLATSAIAYGKIMVLGERGEPVPDGVLVDKAGKYSTDPKDAYEGAILPLAGHKGFALGLFVEILAGPLLGGKAGKKALYDRDGLFILAINPESAGQNDFMAQVTSFCQTIKESSKMQDIEEITLPGDRSYRQMQQNRKNGSIDVTDKTLQNLKVLTK